MNVFKKSVVLIFATTNGTNIYGPASLKYSANKNFYNSGNF